MLLTTMPVMLWVITVFHLVIIVLSFIQFSKTKNILFLLTALVAIGLFYDALVCALGGVTASVELISGLSRARFVLHGALIPLLLPICLYSLGWKKKAQIIVWIITAVIIIAGIAEGFATVLDFKEIGGVIRFTGNSLLTPAWANAISSVLTYGAVAPLIVAGIVTWIQKKGPHLFLSGLLMFAFSAIGPATGNMDLIFYISMYGEVLMILFLFLNAGRINKIQNA